MAIPALPNPIGLDVLIGLASVANWARRGPPRKASPGRWIRGHTATAITAPCLDGGAYRPKIRPVFPRRDGWGRYFRFGIVIGRFVGLGSFPRWLCAAVPFRSSNPSLRGGLVLGAFPGWLGAAVSFRPSNPLFCGGLVLGSFPGWLGAVVSLWPPGPHWFSLV